jgi:H+/gluconate symporter-like permease
MWYLERQRVIAALNGEHFVAAPNDPVSDAKYGDPGYPHWLSAAVPLAVVLGTIILPRVFMMTLDAQFLAGPSRFAELLRFANGQPLVWPSIALFSGTLLASLMFGSIRHKALAIAGQGAQDSIMPLINTAAVIGFGGVVTQTQGFSQFTSVMLESGWPPLLSMFGSVSLTAAITGSASGGLQIFMQTMAPAYLELGIEPAELHRLATMASGGFDSLPHCGAVVAMLTITGLSHKEAYRDVGVITVVIPVVSTLIVIALAMIT